MNAANEVDGPLIELFADGYVERRGITRGQVSCLRITQTGELRGQDPVGEFVWAPGRPVTPLTARDLLSPNVTCAGWTEPRPAVPERDQRYAKRPTVFHTYGRMHHGLEVPFCTQCMGLRSARGDTGAKEALGRWRGKLAAAEKKQMIAEQAQRNAAAAPAR